VARAEKAFADNMKEALLQDFESVITNTYLLPVEWEIDEGGEKIANIFIEPGHGITLPNVITFTSPDKFRCVMPTTRAAAYETTAVSLTPQCSLDRKQRD